MCRFRVYGWVIKLVFYETVAYTAVCGICPIRESVEDAKFMYIQWFNFGTGIAKAHGYAVSWVNNVESNA